jgi:hypothetical protein
MVLRVFLEFGQVLAALFRLGLEHAAMLFVIPSSSSVQALVYLNLTV